MAKHRDIFGMGKSRLCPKRKSEGAKDRHHRRKFFNLTHKAELEAFCRDNGIALSITNEGHHWQARKGKMLIEWWPSSAKVVINKKWKTGIHCHDIRQFQELIKTQMKGL